MSELMKKAVYASDEIGVYSEADVTVEGIFGDILEDVGDGIRGTGVFLKHLATLDMKKYFESRHVSEVYNQVVSAKRFVDNNRKDIDFEGSKDMVIHVPVGFSFRQKSMLDIIEEELEPTKISVLAILQEFNVELGKIISSKKYREGKDVAQELQNMKIKLQASVTSSFIEIDSRLTGLITDGHKKELGSLVFNIEELSANLYGISKQLRVADETELKDLLSSVENLTKRISIFEKLEQDGEISDSVSKLFEELVTTLASGVTVTAKMHHALYTIGEINSAIALDYLR